MGRSFPSTFHPEDKVWTAEIEPYEWDSEEKMRVDMLIEILADDDEDKKIFKQWDCQNEETLHENFLSYKDKLNEFDYDYYNN